MMRPVEGDLEPPVATRLSPQLFAITGLGGLLAIVAAFFMQPTANLQRIPGSLAAVSSVPNPSPRSVQPGPPSVAASTTGAANLPPEQPLELGSYPPSDPHQKLAELMTQMVETQKTRSLAAGRPENALSFASAAPLPDASTLQSGSLASPPPVSAQPESLHVSGSAADLSVKRQAADAASKAIQNGDIIAARSILENSLTDGDGAALLALAETYDPNVLSAMKIRGSYADVKKAHELYSRAEQAGITSAKQRLARLKKFERHH